MHTAKLVSIVNVTPDSFSDGGLYYDPQAALSAIEGAISQGADVIDIGAESTRPGAMPVTPDEEWRRLKPVLSQLDRFATSAVQFSLDTRHAETARAGLQAGVHWINDVSGFSDVAMIEAVQASDCTLVMMHSLSVPADKAIVMDEDADVVEVLLAWASHRLVTLEKSGVSRQRIIFDPGLGFGKTPQQSLAILRGIKRLQTLGMPLLIGHSRKSFLSEFSADCDEATLIISHYLAQRGVDYLRVHDVVRHRTMLNMLEALDVR